MKQVEHKQIKVEEIEIKPKDKIEVHQLLGRPEVIMKFKEEANIKLKEIKKEIDIDANRVIINKTMKADSLKQSKDKPKSVGWIKPYVGKIEKKD